MIKIIFYFLEKEAIAIWINDFPILVASSLLRRLVLA